MLERSVTTEEFNKIIENRLEKIRSVLFAKAGEYASSTDRMHNFNVAARINDQTPEQALWGMYTKHLVSVLDLISWAEICPEKLSKERVDEKIGDSINYHILLEGLLLAAIKDVE